MRRRGDPACPTTTARPTEPRSFSCSGATALSCRRGVRPSGEGADARCQLRSRRVSRRGRPRGRAATIKAVIDGRYEVEERTTVDVEVSHHGTVLATSWALNEASVEKSKRERVLEVAVAVDERPLLRFGCDGVLLCDTDRLDRIRLFGRRPDRVAQRRRVVGRPECGPRAVRSADHRVAAVGDRRRVAARDHPGSCVRRTAPGRQSRPGQCPGAARRSSRCASPEFTTGASASDW